MKNSRQKHVFILILCLGIGFALRFYTFDQKSLWIDEVHTFNDSREGLTGQLKYLKEKPADLLHPPLFYALTHLFYPFEKPERDLRIFPLIFGALSIPMIYFLSRLFSYSIALPCTLSLTFMTYHISISQDGRFYSLLMFLGMLGVYCFMKHLITSKKIYLLLAALFNGLSFYTSYTSAPFIVFSQMFWLYQIKEYGKKPYLSSFLILNTFTLLLCIPWVVFMAMKYNGQFNFPEAEIGSLWSILSNLLNDWVPFAPLTIISVILLALFPLLSKNKRNALLLLGTLLFPVISLYLYCKLTEFQHYLNAKYLINFLPLFFISVFLSLDAIEARFEKLRTYLNLKFLFLILFIGSNVTMLPLYYRSERQDFRGLVRYLGAHLQDGDKIIVKSNAYIPGILHYFKIYPKSRHYYSPLQWRDPEKNEFETKISLVSQNRKFTLYFSNIPFQKYVQDGSRLWIVAGVPAVETIKKEYPCVLKGYFDGSFSNFRKFPSDASMYLFLWDPLSPEEEDVDTLMR